MNSLFEIEIRTNPWIPRDKALLTDKYDNVIGVIDLETPRSRFFRLLNLGSINE